MEQCQSCIWADSNIFIIYPPVIKIVLRDWLSIYVHIARVGRIKVAGLSLNVCNYLLLWYDSPVLPFRYVLHNTQY